MSIGASLVFGAVIGLIVLVIYSLIEGVKR